MQFLYNNSRLKNKRRSLRKNSTNAERKLWGCLKGKQALGLKFWRQYSVGSYIVDFYCPQVRLVIEVDGGQHNEERNQNYDRRRSEYLRKNNIKLLRFWNNEILNNIEGVYQILLNYLKEVGYPHPTSP